MSSELKFLWGSQIVKKKKIKGLVYKFRGIRVTGVWFCYWNFNSTITTSIYPHFVRHCFLTCGNVEPIGKFSRLLSPPIRSWKLTAATLGLILSLIILLRAMVLFTSSKGNSFSGLTANSQ